jgi:hypothetical protein
MPVTPRSIRRAAASRALSIEKVVRSTYQSSAGDLREGGQLAARRHVVLRAHHHADPQVAQRLEMPVRLLDGDGVVVEMCGKPRSSTPALTMTTGMRRSVSAR